VIGVSPGTSDDPGDWGLPSLAGILTPKYVIAEQTPQGAHIAQQPPITFGNGA